MITWRDAMSVGHPVIDADHKTMIGLINAFQKGAPEDVDAILLELLRYTQQHFAREEAIQRACRFPFHPAHRRAHQRLVADLHRLLERWEATPGANQPAVMVDIAAFLREWLVQHILREDRMMTPFVTAAGKSTR